MAVVLLCGTGAVMAASAEAAFPPKGTSFSFHDHVTAGKTWHVEFVVSTKTKHKLTTLVAYSEQCSGTVAKVNVPISDAGVVAMSGGLNGGGTWAVNTTFQTPTTAIGTFRMTRAGCDTGLITYPNAITGNGLGGTHDHGAKYPDFASATPHQRAQARWLHKRVLARWSGVTPTTAAKRGYHRNPAFAVGPGEFHVYNQRYEKDKRIFDPKRPESLVFWRPAAGPPVILGPMFRVPRGPRPKFAGPIPIYHSHNVTKPAPNYMTHVWLVKGAKASWDNCLPVKELEAYNPAFTWTSDGFQHPHFGTPC